MVGFSFAVWLTCAFLSSASAVEWLPPCVQSNHLLGDWLSQADGCCAGEFCAASQRQDFNSDAMVIPLNVAESETLSFGCPFATSVLTAPVFGVDHASKKIVRIARDRSKPQAVMQEFCDEEACKRNDVECKQVYKLQTFRAESLGSVNEDEPMLSELYIGHRCDCVGRGNKRRILAKRAGGNASPYDLLDYSAYGGAYENVMDYEAATTTAKPFGADESNSGRGSGGIYQLVKSFYSSEESSPTDGDERSFTETDDIFGPKVNGSSSSSSNASSNGDSISFDGLTRSLGSPSSSSGNGYNSGNGYSSGSGYGYSMNSFSYAGGNNGSYNDVASNNGTYNDNSGGYDNSYRSGGSYNASEGYDIFSRNNVNRSGYYEAGAGGYVQGSALGSYDFSSGYGGSASGSRSEDLGVMQVYLACSAVRDGTKTKPCKLPFKYHGVVHKACISQDDNDYWCPTKLDDNGEYITGQWGYCTAKCPIENPSFCVTVSGPNVGSFCKFPFRYKETEYYSCTTTEDDRAWCATETDGHGYMVEGKWGYCMCDQSQAATYSAASPATSPTWPSQADDVQTSYPSSYDNAPYYNATPANSYNYNSGPYNGTYGEPSSYGPAQSYNGSDAYWPQAPYYVATTASPYPAQYSTTAAPYWAQYYYSTTTAAPYWQYYTTTAPYVAQAPYYSTPPSPYYSQAPFYGNTVYTTASTSGYAPITSGPYAYPVTVPPSAYAPTTVPYYAVTTTTPSSAYVNPYVQATTTASYLGIVAPNDPAIYLPIGFNDPILSVLSMAAYGR